MYRITKTNKRTLRFPYLSAQCIMVLFLSMAVVPSVALTATYTVTNLNDSGAGSLRQAITDANGIVEDDIIEFVGGLSGTITLLSSLPAIIDNVEILGPGDEILAVDGNSSYRCFEIDWVTTVTIDGLTIQNGYASLDGGGIENKGVLTVTNCTINGNSAADDGGGIENKGVLTVTNCMVSGNSAGDNGGGIENSTLGTSLEVTDCTIELNHAAAQGGGINNVNTLTVTNSTFNKNYATASDGGGICNIATLTLINCTLRGNSAGNEGGGSYSRDTLTIINCTFSGNSASDRGGGIRRAAGTVNLQNTILADNIGNYGPDCYGTINSQDYNLIEDTSGCTIAGTTSHNIYGVDPELSALSDNGGPTDTMALCKAGDTTGVCAGTVTDSPAIDQIPPSSGACGSTAPYNEDQRGEARPYDAGCDIGAYERTVTTPVELVINEVMAFPSGSANEEWVEIYVNSSPGDVGGYDLHDQDTHTITFPSFTPAAGEYIIVVTGVGDDQLATSPYVIYRDYGSGYWNDDGDDVVLRDPSDNCIDYMAYDDGASIDAPPAGCSWSSTSRANPQSPQGTSISLISDGADTDQASDWATSGDSGTVGPHSQGYANEGPTAVELIKFEATAHASGILIAWETASEIDSEGFQLWRTESVEEPYERITAEVIAAEGGPLWGASYTYEDLDVEMGKTYWYKLEDIDIYGQSKFHGPVEATAQSACGVVDGSDDGYGALWLLVLAVPAAFVVAGRKRLAKKRKSTGEKKERPETYEPPKILTYSGEELLEELGPAQACRGFTCPVSPTP